jgi:signal peptidase I
MTANSIFLVFLAAFGLGAFALVLTSIKYGFKWSKVADIGLLKAFGLHILFTLTAIVVCIVVLFVAFVAGAKPSESILNIFGCVCEFLIPPLVVVAWYKVRFWRAALALVPFFVSSFLVLAFASFIVRPYLYESFSVPTNAMAPTILGEHSEAPCPRCGQTAYGSPLDEHSHVAPEGVPMICSQELRSVLVNDVPRKIGHGDRITVCKPLVPKRWDLIVFRYPADPTVNYVKRLVGLPGEKLEIREGAVWIDGEKMEPPSSISNIRYSPTVESHGRTYSGPGSSPVELGPDEYFVLGDFVDQSSDSRMWEHGAPGHPPYAVPASHIVGVVSNIYWPPSRWASFR